MRAETSPVVIKAFLLAVFVSCATLILHCYVPSARAATCSNEAIRAEQGAAALALSDCRAYELASPESVPSLTKDTKLEFGGGKASPSGDAVSYYSRYPASGSQTSSETWLSARTVNGWSLKSLDPQLTPTPTTYAVCQPGVALSENLDAYLLSAGGDLSSSNASGYPGECGIPVEELVAGEPRGYSNLYLRRGDSPYALVNPAPAGVTPANATYQAASPDLSHIVFSEESMLTPDSEAESKLFEWVEGTIREVGILPSGDHVSATLGAATEDWGEGGGGTFLGLAPVSHAVSADGERVFFEANGNLYLRENAGQAPAADANCRTTSEANLACTLQIDVSKGAGTSGGGLFQFASRDGDRVFFTSDHALTFPSSAQAGKPDLYEFDVSAKQLVDLTVAASGTANVRGISGGSDDGTHLYFVARGVLTGSQQNGQGEVAQSGQPNLYLAREKALTYVATLSPWETGEGSTTLGGKDRFNWWEPLPGSPKTGRLKTAWSPSGRYLVFSSFKPLTGFDNSPAEPGLCGLNEPSCEELFLYDAEADELVCISCDATSDKPVGNTRLVERAEFLRLSPGPRYAPRVVLDDGRVFFDTENPLSPQDEGGFKDVYQYQDGGVSLISSGAAKGGSTFLDASADGSDIFFITPESLVRRDDDGGLPSVYDARVNGGFAEPPLPPAPCAGEQCHPAGPPPPAAPLPATSNFTGSGNVKAKPCRHGKVRRGGKCVKKKKHRHHHKRHQAGNNRGNN